MLSDGATSSRRLFDTFILRFPSVVRQTNLTEAGRDTLQQTHLLEMRKRARIPFCMCFFQVPSDSDFLFCVFFSRIFRLSSESRNQFRIVTFSLISNSQLKVCVLLHSIDVGPCVVECYRHQSVSDRQIIEIPTISRLLQDKQVTRGLRVVTRVTSNR